MKHPVCYAAVEVCIVIAGITAKRHKWFYRNIRTCFGGQVMYNFFICPERPCQPPPIDTMHHVGLPNRGKSCHQAHQSFPHKAGSGYRSACHHRRTRCWQIPIVFPDPCSFSNEQQPNRIHKLQDIHRTRPAHTIARRMPSGVTVFPTEYT